MAFLAAAETLTFPRLSRADIESAIERLKELLSKSEDFRRRARSAEKRLSQLSTYNINSGAELSIQAGLVSVILGTERRFVFPGDWQFEVFAYLITTIYSKLSTEEAPFVLGKVKSGLNDERHFDSIFFELLVGYAYHAHGNDVSFRDLKTGAANTKNYDFDVAGRGARYSAEVKTIDMHNAVPYTPAWVNDELLKLRSFLIQDARWVDFRAEVQLKGESHPSRLALTDSMNECLSGLKIGLTCVKSTCFDIDVANDDPGATDRFLSKYASGDLGYLRPTFNVLLSATSPRTKGFVGMRSSIPWSFNKCIAKSIRGAADQLISQRPQALWLRPIGATTGKADVQAALTQMMQVDNLIQVAAHDLHSDIKSRGAGELVCVHLVGNTEYQASDEGVIQVGMNQALIPPTRDQKSLHQYLSDTVDSKLSSPLRLQFVR